MHEPSLIEIKRAIPQHCFRSHAGWSLFFAGRALAFSALAAVLLYQLRLSTAWGTHWVISVLYALLQGTLFWGLFTLGHDCGHGAFSRYPWVNWMVGNTLHTILLTPYEAWRLSHRSHHQHTGHRRKDEIFYPNPPYHHVALTALLGVAWFLYLLLANVPGRRKAYHYYSPEFRQHWPALGASFASILFFCIALLKTWSLPTLMVYYFAPLFVFASWLVVVTFLHHHHWDSNVPWYDDASWNVVRGALASVDRDYGWFVNHVTHHIELHQIHHLFPIIPHYHLPAATQAFRARFPQLVHQAGRSNAWDFCSGVYAWSK